MNLDRLDTVVVVWLWSQKVPVDAAKVVKPISALMPADAADAIQVSLERLSSRGDVTRTEKKAAKGKASKAQYAISDAGLRRMQSTFGRATPPKTSPFPSLVAGPLSAMALDAPVPATDADLKAFKKSLPLAICAKPLGISLSPGAEAAKGAILARALGRLFNPPAVLTIKKVPAGQSTIIAMAAELGIPPDNLAFKTVDKLIEVAAMRAMGVTSKPADLAPAVVRRWLSEGSAAAALDHVSATTAATAPTPSASAGGSLAASPPSSINPASFARNVLAAARDVVATNGRGVSNLRDQVLVASVCERYGELFGRVGLDDFKKHLRDISGGEVMLVCEDRIPADRQQEFRESEVRIGTSVFHYIRI